MYNEKNILVKIAFGTKREKGVRGNDLIN